VGSDIGLQGLLALVASTTTLSWKKKNLCLGTKKKNGWYDS
jgi:hypothetical protein